jgi:hypothetical protein
MFTWGGWGSTWGHINETAKYQDQDFPHCIYSLLLTDLELNHLQSSSGARRNNQLFENRTWPEKQFYTSQFCIDT